MRALLVTWFILVIDVYHLAQPKMKHAQGFFYPRASSNVWPSVIPTKIPSNNPTDKVRENNGSFSSMIELNRLYSPCPYCSKTHILMYMQYGEGVSIMP